jgi:hypothetical protein
VKLERCFEQLEVVGVGLLDVQPEAIRVRAGETSADRGVVGVIDFSGGRQ